MVTILPSLRKLKGGIAAYKKKYNIPDANSEIKIIDNKEKKRLEEIAKKANTFRGVFSNNSLDEKYNKTDDDYLLIKCRY